MNIFTVFILFFTFSKSLFAYTYSNKMPGPYISSSETIGIENWKIEAIVDYWSTDGFKGEEGREIELQSEQSFTQTDIDLNLTYGYRRNFDIFTEFKFRQVHSTNTDHDVTTTGPETIGAGVKYNLPRSSDWDFSLSTKYIFSIWSPTNYGSYAQAPIDEVALGDGENIFNINAHLALRKLSGFGLDFTVGMNIYDGNQSQEVIFDAAIVKVNHEWALIGGLEGVHSLETDTYTDTPGAKYVTGRQSTLRYNSINESYYSPYGKINFKMGQKSILSLKFYGVREGEYTDTGYGAVVGWTYKFKTKKSSSELFVEKFKDYDIEGFVVKVSPRQRFVKIDRGLSDDIEKGSRIDIFKVIDDGENILVASGKVFEAKSSSAIVKIMKTYRNFPIAPGFVARSRSK